ncbi:MAG: hypothetical protein Q9201_005207 [Fulgogasparrea decipioides]
MAASTNESIPLSVLDQLPFMRTFTQMLLCFPVAAASDRSRIVSTLQQATANLLQVIPSLAGQIQNLKDEESSIQSSGTFRVVPYTHPDGSALRVKYLDDFPSYDDLRHAKAPASMLDGNILAPMKGFPDHYTDADVTPAFIVQANFIPGGLLLCFSGMHNLMDGTGLGQVINMFAALCRGEAISAKRLESANLDRAKLPVSLNPGQPAMSHPEMAAKKHDEAQRDEANPSPQSLWSYFTIPSSKLAELKAEASRNLSSEIPYVTTNDALTAWIWRAVSKAREPHIDTSKETLLLRTVNGRRVLSPPLPGTYIGNCVSCARNKLTCKILTDETPLWKLAQAVRKATIDINDHYVRSLATFIESEPDKHKITFVIDAPDRDLMLSSWASLPVWDDFGYVLGGKPEFVRRPTGTPWSGVCYIMPQRPDGGMDLLVALREDDMERLRGDEEVKRIAEHIG